MKKFLASLGLIAIFSFMLGILAGQCEQSLHRDITNENLIKAILEVSVFMFFVILVIILAMMTIGKLLKIITE